MLIINRYNNYLIVVGVMNSTYPQNGTLIVPINSLIMAMDESEMVTFLSADNFNVLFSGLLGDIYIDGNPVGREAIVDLFIATQYTYNEGGGDVDLSNYYTKYDVNRLLRPIEVNVDAHTSKLEDIETAMDDKQDVLIDGVNIKSINGETILGEGNIDTYLIRSNTYYLEPASILGRMFKQLANAAKTGRAATQRTTRDDLDDYGDFIYYLHEGDIIYLPNGENYFKVIEITEDGYGTLYIFNCYDKQPQENYTTVREACNYIAINIDNMVYGNYIVGSVIESYIQPRLSAGNSIDINSETNEISVVGLDDIAADVSALEADLTKKRNKPKKVLIEEPQWMSAILQFMNGILHKTDNNEIYNLETSEETIELCKTLEEGDILDLNDGFFMYVHIIYPYESGDRSISFETQAYGTTPSIWFSFLVNTQSKKTKIQRLDVLFQPRFQLDDDFFEMIDYGTGLKLQPKNLIKQWVGTEDEYNAIDKEDDTLYFIHE